MPSALLEIYSPKTQVGYIIPRVLAPRAALLGLLYMK